LKKSILLLLSIFVVAILLTACGGNEANTPANSDNNADLINAPEPGVEVVEEAEFTIEHQLGTTVVPKNPEKVVVFDYGIIDSLDKLQIPMVAMPKSNVPPYIQHINNDTIANAGTLQEPDFEMLANLGPDLIIISARQSAHYEELSKLAPTIFMGVDNAAYLESFSKNMRTLGKIFDKEADIEQELARITSELADIKQKVANEGEALIILTNNGNISAYGSGSRFGIIHGEMGFAAADENIEVATHGANVSFEYILEENPDYLFVVDRGAVVTTGDAANSGKDTLENDIIKRTSAYKNGNIIYLDPSYWYLSGGGLVSVSSMVDEITAAIAK